jgi:hypothetical protein
MSTIEDKKKGTPTNYMSNLSSFFYNVIVLCIIVLFYYTSSGLLLYACKLAQSNILPTQKKCAPYTDSIPNIQPIQSNIFNTYTNPSLSMKINFPYNKENASNILLNLFREYKNEPNSNFLANYFISIIESVIHFNYSTLNTLLNVLNSYIPETLIVLFGPIIISIISICLFFADNIYLIYLWFAKMSWFFKTNTNESSSGLPNWKDVHMLNIFKYVVACWLMIIFIIMLFFIIPIFPIISALSIGWCAITCIMYKAEMNDTIITAAKIVQDIFKYYKLSIIRILSFCIIISAFNKLGTVSGIFSIITLALVYFGIISIDIFKTINKDHLSAMVSWNQANKTCNYKDKGTTGSWFGGGKHISIEKELRNLVK